MTEIETAVGSDIQLPLCVLEWGSVEKTMERIFMYEKLLMLVGLIVGSWSRGGRGLTAFNQGQVWLRILTSSGARGAEVSQTGIRCFQPLRD